MAATQSTEKALLMLDLQASARRWKYIAVAALVTLFAAVVLLALVGVVAARLIVENRRQAEAAMQQALMELSRAEEIVLQECIARENAVRAAEQLPQQAESARPAAPVLPAPVEPVGPAP
jgi:hypothetical protein